MRTHLVVLAGALGLAACTHTHTVLRAERARAMPLVPGEALRQTAAGNAAFASDLYRVVSTQQAGNLMFSPHGIGRACGMVYAGAGGATAQEMAKALHITQPQPRYHEAANKLDQLLAGRGKNARGTAGKPFQLKMVNAAWAQQGYRFRAEYLDLLAAQYGAGVGLLDFQANPQGATDTINAWVDDETEGRIPKLVDRLRKTTRLVLTSAIYFDAAWKAKFKVGKRRAFHKLDGRQVQAPMLEGTQELSYLEAKGLKAVAVPYDGGAMSFVALAPDRGTFAAFERGLTPKRLQALTAAVWTAPRRQVTLHMPKLRFRTKFSLKKTLERLGMQTVFSDQADLSGMDPADDLKLFDVLHQTTLELDEEGTVATAATAAVVGLRAAAPAEPKTLVIDRPYVFLIRDDATGAVLFMGRVVDPTIE